MFDMSFIPENKVKSSIILLLIMNELAMNIKIKKSYGTNVHKNLFPQVCLTHFVVFLI